MQASNLSASEKALGAGVALLSAFGAYQGVDASNQVEKNRVRMDSLRLELDEHQTVRNQMSKLMVVDTTVDANLWQVPAQYELAALTLARLPKKDHEAYSRVLERIMESLLSELDIKKQALDSKLNENGPDRTRVVADLQRIESLALRMRTGLDSLRKTAQASGIRLEGSKYLRVVLFLCSQTAKAGKEPEAAARRGLREIQSKYFPTNVAVWDARVESERSRSDFAALQPGKYVIADRGEEAFAKSLVDVLNKSDFSLGATSASTTWKVADQTGSGATPLYLSMYYCPAPNQKGPPANSPKGSGT